MIKVTFEDSRGRKVSAMLPLIGDEEDRLMEELKDKEAIVNLIMAGISLYQLWRFR